MKARQILEQLVAEAHGSWDPTGGRPVPPEVQEVATAAKASARDAGLPDGAVFLHYVEKSQWGEDEGWNVSDNYETGVGSLVLRNGKWFHRSPSTGEDHELRGGQAEAVESAGIMFTG